MGCKDKVWTLNTNILVKISTININSIIDDFLGTEIWNELAGNLDLGKTGDFVATIVTAEIGDGRFV